MDAVFKNFLNGFFTAFFFLVLLLSNPGFVYAAELNNSVSTQATVAFFADTTPTSSNPLVLGSGVSVNQSNPQIPSTQTTTNQIPFTTSSTTPTTTSIPAGSCSVSKLSPTEAKDIMNLTHEGFAGGVITTGTDANDSKARDIGDTSLVGTELGGNKAVKVEAPNYAASADKFSFLDGQSFTGPFGIGIIIDDTMRIGRCTNLSQSQCLINGEGLKVRTSGVGFKEDMVDAFKSVVGATKNVAQSQLSTSDYTKLRGNYVDINSNDFKTGTFGEGEAVSNSILTNQYTAKNATTCNNSACTISTYSTFDKYFNAWMTTDMVVSNIGPMLLQKSGKLLTQAYKSFGGDPLKSKFGLQIPQVLRDKITGLTSPMSLFGSHRDARFKAMMHESGLSSILEEKLVINKALWSSGAKGEVTKLTDPSSPLWKLSADKREKAFEAIEHLSAYARASISQLDEAKVTYDAAVKAAEAITDPALKTAAIKAAKVDYGMKAAVNLDDWDETLALDFEDWAKANDDLFSFGGYAVKKNGDWANDTGYVDISSGQPFNFKRVVQQFGATDGTGGSWAKWASSNDSSTFKVAADGASLQLYKIAPKEVIAENIGLQDLRFHLSKMGPSTYSIKFPDGTYRPLNEASIKYIEASPTLPGHVSIYNSGYVPAEPLTPEDFANRITDKRIVGRPKTAVRNLDDLKNGLIQNDFAPRKFTSLLDQQYAAEGDMVSKYYKQPVTGVYKGLVLPVLYWDFKQGFGNYSGNKDYSAFLLPDSWSTLSVTQGVDKVYSDSYIDFFVNEGSDQGDMFKRAFTAVPLVWTKIVQMTAETNQTVKDTLSKVSGGFFEGSGAMRDTVGDVAFYSHNENCSGCSEDFTFSNGYLQMGLAAPVQLKAFFLEANTPEEKIKTGTTLISYTHHSDLKGKTGQVEGEQINISDAQTNSETCDAKLRKLGLGWAGNAAGGVLAAGENIAYLFGFGPGLMASLVQQLTIGRELQDCIDSVEGYYVHFYAPPSKDAANSKSKATISNEKITETLSGLTEKLDSFVKENKANDNSLTNTTTATPNVTAATLQNPLNATGPKVNGANPIENSMDKLKTQFDDFTNKAKQANILQASVDLLPLSTGKVMGKDVFYFWFKETGMPAKYRTQGKMTITDGNMSVEQDLEKGTLKINGKTVLGADKADHVRMIAQDNKGPFNSVPVTLNKVAAPLTASTVFEMNTAGEIKVLNLEVLNCIQKAIYDQTGINYSGDELTQVFGDLTKLSTENYSSIIVNGGKIYFEGMGPRFQGENGSKFIIDGYWATKLVADKSTTTETGKFVGMAFKNGSIVLKPETNELIIWLRQHKDSILTNTDVKGMNAKLTTVKDPTSECDMPAIDLSAVPFNNDELGAKKVENFNTSMDHLGPFTQFVTGNRIYEFYAKRDEASGQCKNFFRVIDRNSGKILTDQEIVGGISQNADGTIRFKTADGKDNSLSFSAENGVPKVSYNGGPQETLLSAQGPNGSFWYDPEKGLWYPENGLQIPLNQAYKDNGAWFGADSKGNVTGVPENKITFNTSGNNSPGFSLPSMPETLAGMAIFISLFLLISFMLTQGQTRKKKRKY